MTEPEQRAVPALPEQLDGVNALEWTSWEPAIDASHIDPSCATCGHQGPPVHAYGVADLQWEVTLPTGKRQPGEKRNWATVSRSGRVRVFLASRCRACDEMRIYRMGRQPPRNRRMKQVFYLPPRTRQPEGETT